MTTPDSRDRARDEAIEALVEAMSGVYDDIPYDPTALLDYLDAHPAARAALARWLVPDDLRELSDAASPGPWVGPEHGRIAHIVRERAGGAQVFNAILWADAALIVAAVNYVRATLSPEAPSPE